MRIRMKNEKRKSRIRNIAENGISGDDVFDFFNIVLLTIFAIIVFYPMYFVVIASISSPSAVASGQVVLLPKGNNFLGFQRVLRDERLKTGYLNSTIYTVVGVIVNLVMTLPAAYVLSRDDFKLKKPLTIFIIFTMFFGGGMIPNFIVVKQLGLLDKIWALVLPGAISTSKLILARTFFQTTIPDELFDSALIDGCGNFKFFINIVIPISGAIIGILALQYGIEHWNAYGSALLYIYNPKKYPLQLILRDILLRSQITAKQMESEESDALLSVLMQQISESIKYVIVIAACLPIVVVLPLIKKYFAKGIMIGSIKG